MGNLQPVELPQVDESHKRQLPRCLSNLLDMSPMDRAEKLAKQFYQLEVKERSRLEGAFKWQASSSNEVTDQEQRERSPEGAKSKYAKYGISAGFELGNLNRFKNIFPVRFFSFNLAGADERSSTSTLGSSSLARRRQRRTTSTPQKSSSPLRPNVSLLRKGL